MSQHKDIQYWKKRKTEVERAFKTLALKREKTLYLYEMEKQSRRKPRESQLQALLEYETRELQQAQAGLQKINSTIAGLEKEEKKYSDVKVAGLLSLLAILFTFAGLLLYQDDKGATETILEESTPSISWIDSWSDTIFAFLQKYSSGNNALTGAVVGIQPEIDNCHEGQNCVDETIPPIIEEPVPEDPEIPTEDPTEHQIDTSDKSLFSPIVDQIIETIWPEDLGLMAITRMVLNTTYMTQGNTNVNLTTHVTGTDLKYIYNWLRNDTPIAVLHMTFDGGSDPSYARDYSGKNNLYNSSYQGIHIGYVTATNQSSGSFAVDADRCNGAADTDEWDVNGTSLVNFDAVRNLSDINSNTCVFTQDGYRGVGFIMYSNTRVSARFTVPANNHEHFIYVNYSNDGWRHDDDTTWRTFTPENTDVLIAYADSNLNTVTIFPFLPNRSSRGYNESGAYQFNGSSDYVNITDNDNLDFGGNNFSISIWARINGSSTSDEALVAKVAGDPATNPGYVLGFNTGQPFFTVTNGAGTQAQALNGTTAWKDNTWHHYVGTFNRSTSILYIDGIVRGTSTIAVTINPDNAQPLYLGRIGSGFFLNGTLDEFMIFNRSLSPQQVWALWINQSNVMAQQELNKGDKWTVQVTPNTGSADGTTMTQSVFIYPPVINAITLNSTNTSINDTTVNLTAYANASDADGDSVKVIYNWMVNNTPIAVLNMPFEGINGTTSNNTLDYSGNRNHASEQNGATWIATGGYDAKGAYRFDGVNDFLTAPIFNPGTGSFTWMGWLKTTDNVQSLMFNHWDGSGGDAIAIGVGGLTFSCKASGFGGGDADNVINMVVRDGTVPYCVNSTTVVNDNKWYHIAGVRRNDTLEMYVNGILETSLTGLNGLNILPTPANITIGGGSGFWPLTADIDEVYVFNRSLSREQIFAIFQNKSNITVAQETVKGDNWTVQATPNDGTGDGATVISNNITILNTKPIIAPLVLNTTNMSSNNTNVNLTAYANASDADNDSIKVIYNWLRNNTPIMLVNMPMEGINRTDVDNGWDYSGYGNNASEGQTSIVHAEVSATSALWNATGGYDGKGAYMFDGINDYISIRDSNAISTFNYSITMWVKLAATGGANWMLIKGDNRVDTGAADRGEGAGYEFAISGGGEGANDRPEVQIYGTGSCTEFLATATTSMANGTWTHIGVVYIQNTSATVYVNGVQEAQDTTKPATCNNQLGSSNIDVGRRNLSGLPSWQTYYFNGTIDELMIFNRSLSAQQVLAIFQNKTNVTLAQETVLAENWTVVATPNDGTEDGATVISNNVTILNTAPPAPVLVSPANLTTTTSRTPTFVWNNSVDFDNDPNISYRLEIDNSILFNNLEVNVAGITNTTNDNTTYTIATELAVDTTFFWRVFAYDQRDNSVTANVGNFTVQSLLAVNITNNLVAFGTLANGANVTTPANANPFRGENVGNIFANITVTGTPFFTAVSMPSTFYSFNISANESSAFDTTLSAMKWNQTNSTLNALVFHVVNLDWHSISNDFLTNLNVSVPGNESAGSKSSNLTFTITG